MGQGYERASDKAKQEIERWESVCGAPELLGENNADLARQIPEMSAVCSDDTPYLSALFPHVPIQGQLPEQGVSFGVFDCGDEAVVQVPITVEDGPHATQEEAMEAVPRWQEGIDRVWNHEFYFDQGEGGSLPLRFQPDFTPARLDGARNPDRDLAYENRVAGNGATRAHHKEWQNLDSPRALSLVDDPAYGMDPAGFAEHSTESINNIAAHEFGHLLTSQHIYDMDATVFESWAGRPPIIGEERGAAGHYMRRDDVMGSCDPQARLESLDVVESKLSETLGSGTIGQYVEPPAPEEMECSPYFLP
jgi:hypothetical protein